LQDEERLLVQRLQTRETADKAFRELVDLHKERLYWHIRNIVKNHDDTDDVLQNTFVKVFRNIKKFKGESKLFSWMYRIATNESITFLNSKARKMKLSNEELQQRLVENLESDVYFEGEQAELQLQKAISRLPEKQRLVFNMRYFEEMKYSDMAEILEVTEGSLKSNYHHASKKIEAYLKENSSLVKP
jgi:RNA polymerase sigma-70 factor (ECF subfamily)